MKTTRTERLEARLTKSQKLLFEEAASHLGLSLSDFVVSKLIQVSYHVLRSRQRIWKEAEVHALKEFLQTAPEPNALALRAMQRLNDHPNQLYDSTPPKL